MNIEARKLRLIQVFSNLNDVKLIDQLEVLLLKKARIKKTVLDQLSGAWTKEEAEEIKKVIAEGCENIDENEWQ